MPNHDIRVHKNIPVNRVYNQMPFMQLTKEFQAQDNFTTCTTLFILHVPILQLKKKFPQDFKNLFSQIASFP